MSIPHWEFCCIVIKLYLWRRLFSFSVTGTCLWQPHRSMPSSCVYSACTRLFSVLFNIMISVWRISGEFWRQILMPATSFVSLFRDDLCSTDASSEGTRRVEWWWICTAGLHIWSLCIMCNPFKHRHKQVPSSHLLLQLICANTDVKQLYRTKCSFKGLMMSVIICDSVASFK